jgi:uncharacterized protein (DUF305 family)
MKIPKLSSTFAILALTAAAAGPLPASADAMAGATPAPAMIDCSKATMFMHQAMPMDHAVQGGAMSGGAMHDDAMSGQKTVDQEFASSMVAMNKSTIQMAKIETHCGKDAKVKAAAQKTLDDAMARQSELMRLEGG